MRLTAREPKKIDDSGRRYKSRNIEAVLASKVLTHRFYLIGLENFHGREAKALFNRAIDTLIGYIRMQWPYPRQLKKADLPDGYDVSRELNKVGSGLWRIQEVLFKSAGDALETWLEEELEEQVLYEHKWFYSLILRHIPIRIQRESAFMEAAPESDEYDWWDQVEESGMYQPLSRTEARRRVKQIIPDGRFKYLGPWKHGRVRGQLVKGLVNGWGMDKITRELHKVLRGSRHSAERIARTSTMRASNRIAREAYDNNKHAVAGIQNYATLDRQTCMVCGSLDKEMYWYEGEPNVNAAPHYPIHDHCRCFQAPVSRLWQRLGIERPWTKRASKEGPVAYKHDWEDWMRNMEKGDPGFAKDVFRSRLRYDIWKSGVPVDRLMKKGVPKFNKQMVYNLDTLKRKGIRLLK